MFFWEGASVTLYTNSANTKSKTKQKITDICPHFTFSFSFAFFFFYFYFFLFFVFDGYIDAVYMCMQTRDMCESSGQLCIIYHSFLSLSEALYFIGIYKLAFTGFLFSDICV